MDELYRVVGSVDPDFQKKVLNKAYEFPQEERSQKIGELLAQHIWVTNGAKRAAIIFTNMIKGKDDYKTSVKGSDAFKERAYNHVMPDHCSAQVNEARRYLQEYWKDIETDTTIISDDDQIRVDKWVKRRRSEEQKALAVIRRKKAILAADSARGQKVLNAAKESGAIRARQFQPLIDAALRDLDEYRRKHCPPVGTVSISSARKRIADKHKCSAKTLERHDIARHKK